MAAEKVGRRSFLKTFAAGVGTLAALRLKKRTTAPGAQADGSRRWAMVIDQAKCIGCGYCTLACRAHNDVPQEMSWNRVRRAG
ncbi:MAG TPA: 4Fe-4S binding protein, partial [Anaerolineales bacterium]